MGLAEFLLVLLGLGEQEVVALLQDLLAAQLVARALFARLLHPQQARLVVLGQLLGLLAQFGVIDRQDLVERNLGI